jgi:hypothetical protein
MAEPSDPSRVATDTGITAAPPISETERPTAYRPLSLLAIAGFVVAAVFTAGLALFVVVSFFMRSSAIQVWLLAIPVLAALLSWAGRLKIQASEDTLSGLALTRWGIGLSLVVGLIYAAYCGGTYWAIRQQASNAAFQFLDKLRNEDVEGAYALTLRSRPASGPDLRATLENLQAGPDSRGAGSEFAQFQQVHWVRCLQYSSPKAEIEQVGVGEWKDLGGGHQLAVTFRVTSEVASFNMTVTVGSWEAKGRVWGVDLRSCTASELNMSSAGETLLRRAEAARSFANDWLSKVAERKEEEVYLSLFFDDQRKAASERFKKSKDAGQPTLAEWAGLVRAEAPTFWADPSKRDEVVDEVKKVFQCGDAGPFKLSPMRVQVPTWSEDKDFLRFGIDFQLMLQKHPFMAEGRIIVEAELANINAPKPWRIHSVELVRAKTAPAGGPGGAGGMRAPLPGPPGGQ